MNLFELGLEGRSERDGYRGRGRAIGAELGASRIGAGVDELPPGQQTYPFHYHHGVEEWLVVLAGTATVRTAEGELTLGAWDTICFPSGPAGAHAVRNDGEAPARLLMLSNVRDPSIAVYPDSGKLGPRGGELGRLNFRLADAVDYWDGE